MNLRHFLTPCTPSTQVWSKNKDIWGHVRTETEKAMAPHSSTLAWKIPWMEEPGRLPSMGSLRVGHDWATSLSLFTFVHWRRKWQLTPVILPGESRDGGDCWAAVYGVTQSQTRLKRLSSSSKDWKILSPVHWFLGKLIEDVLFSKVSRLRK